jgi:hypothetical protein
VSPQPKRSSFSIARQLCKEQRAKPGVVEIFDLRAIDEQFFRPVINQIDQVLLQQLSVVLINPTLELEKPYASALLLDDFHALPLSYY